MDLSEYVDESTLAALRRLLPNAPFQPILTPLTFSSESSVSIELPLPIGAEYRFILFFLPERHINVRLLNADVTHYFWYMPFEDAAFANSIEHSDAAFIETIERIVRHETRIIQKRTVLNHYFKCEYRSNLGWNACTRMRRCA